MRIRAIFCLVFSLFILVFSEEDYYQVRACCAYSGPHFKDIELTITARFNKYNMMEYNSTRGNWIGFTPLSIVFSSYWNRDPYDALERMFEKKLMCDDNLHYIQSLGNFSTPPTVKIKMVKQPGSGHPTMLVCSAYNFYPKQIRMTWLRNKQEVTRGVSYSYVMADGKLYFQVHSFLEYSPTYDEKITCMVEHFTLSEPKIVVWDNVLPAEEKIKIFIGLCGLIFGLLILSFGFIYYKRKSGEYIIFSRGRTLIPVEPIPAAGTGLL